MTDLQLYSLVIGFGLPPALALVQQTGWSNRLRATVAFLACLVAGAGAAYFEGELNGRRFVTASLVVLTTGMATYRNFWKPTGVTPAIEERTTFDRWRKK